MGPTILRYLLALIVTGTGALAAKDKAKPAPPPKPSEPVVKDGLSIAVQPAKSAYARQEPIVLAVTLKNVSKEPITLAGTRSTDWRPSPGFAFRVKEAESGRVRTLHEGMNPMIMAPVRLESRKLAGGQSVVIRASLDRWSWYMAPAPAKKNRKARPRQVRKFLGPEMLPGGTYEVTVQGRLGRGFAAGKGITFWVGEIAANAVVLKIDAGKVAKDPARPVGRDVPAGPWQELFASQAWYKGRKGPERLFTGVLQAAGGAGGPSTLMRAAYYRLGEWRLYTGARKHPVLDQLVGKPVRIRGKAVEMNLEGQHLREIWPGAVRPVRPAAGAPSGPKVSPPVKPKTPPVRRGRLEAKSH